MPTISNPVPTGQLSSKQHRDCGRTFVFVTESGDYGRYEDWMIIPTNLLGRGDTKGLSDSP